jgi:GT2 family glycosyltransferase
MEPALSGAKSRLVSIVVVTWNSATYLPRCLEGIARQTWPAVELIAVDNASADESVALLEEFLGSGAGGRGSENASRAISEPIAPRPSPEPRPPTPPITIIRNPANAGFARAVNQAIAVARGEFVQLVNPDAFLEPEYIERLVAAFDAAGNEFGAAAGTLFRGEGASISATGVIDSKGIRMTRSGRHLDIGQGRCDGEDDRGLVRLNASFNEVFGVSGAAPMYRRTFIDEVTVDGQFFDEDFFTYREDADVAWRGRIFGWRALHAPDAVAIHVRTVTPERRRDIADAVNMHSVKNRFLLRMKNEALYLAFRNAPFEILRDLVTIGAVMTVERSSLPGLRWVWQNRSRVLEHRREIQRRRRVSDRDLARWFR